MDEADKVKDKLLSEVDTKITELQIWIEENIGPEDDEPMSTQLDRVYELCRFRIKNN